MLSAVYAGAEVLGRMSEAGLEARVAGSSKPAAVLAITRVYASSTLIPLAVAALASYGLGIAAVAAGPRWLAAVLLALSLLSSLWGRNLAAGIAVRAGLYSTAARASVAAPVVTVLLFLVGGWYAVSSGLLAFASGYVASLVILVTVLRAVGLVSSRYRGSPGAGMPDPGSIVSSAKYVAASVLAFAGLGVSVVAVAVLFDGLHRLAVLLYAGVGRRALALDVLVLAPGVIVGDPLLLVYSIVLAVAGLFGLGGQAPLRCIMCA